MLQGKKNHQGQHCLGREDITNLKEFKNCFRSIRNGVREKMAYIVMDGKIIEIISFQIVKWYVCSID